MFRLRKEIERLDIEARRIYRLYRSLGDIQVALAGLPSQEATAYVCAFGDGGEFRVTVALYLKQSDRVAFYVAGEAPVSKGLVAKVLEEGIRFAESMGFMMGDTDFHLLDSAGKEVLWDSLPLCNGAAATPESKRQTPAESVGAPSSSALDQPEPIGAPVAKTRGESPVEETIGSPAGFPASRLSHRKPLTEEEMAGRREEFLGKLGRFLASF